MQGRSKLHPWRGGFRFARGNYHCRNNQKVTKTFTCIRKSSLICKADSLAILRCQAHLENCKANQHKIPASATGICSILLELYQFIRMSRTTHHHPRELQEIFLNWKKIRSPRYHRYCNNLRIEGYVCQTCIPCWYHLFDNGSSSPM